MGLRAAKIAPYSSASRSKQLLCCFFAYLAKIDPIDFLKPPWLCGSNRRHLWFTNTHTHYIYLFLRLLDDSHFFSRSCLSSRQLILLDLEWNCDKQFSFRSTSNFEFDLEKKVDDDVPNVTNTKVFSGQFTPWFFFNVFVYVSTHFNGSKMASV